MQKLNLKDGLLYTSISIVHDGKNIDKIICGDIELENTKLDFGDIDPNERVNGLLGLDLIMDKKI